MDNYTNKFRIFREDDSNKANGAAFFHIINGGNVGIGTDNPSRRLHIVDGSSGANVDSTATQVVIENSADAGIHIMNPNGNIGRVMFGTPARMPSGLIRWDNTNNNFDFSTDKSGAYIRFLTDLFQERMRIVSGGAVGINYTNPAGYGQLTVNWDVTNTANNNGVGLAIRPAADTTDAYFAIFFNSTGSGIGSIRRVGTTNAVAYNTSSDRRLKENIVPAQSASSIIDNIEVVQYDWKEGTHVRHGIIAQDLYSVAPEAVSIGDSEEIENPRNPWGVDYASYAQANTARTTANDAYGQANTARDQANTARTQANTAYDQANNARGQANTAYGQANAAYGQANAAYGAANTRLSASGGTLSGDLIITGNLTVSGNQTILNTEVLTTEDAEIILLSNTAGTPALNAGLIINRGTSTNTFLRWNETLDEWGWSDSGTTTYYFEDLRAGLATTNTTFGTVNTSLGTINTSYQAAYAQANTAGTNALNAYGAANNRVLKAGDTMTGQLNISAGGLLVTGNVGLGTASPSTLLELTGVGNPTYRQIYINTTSTLGAGITLKPSGTNAISWSVISSGNTASQGAGSLLFYRDATDGSSAAVTFVSNGSVGINTIAPQSRLEVNLISGDSNSLMNANSVNDVALLRAPFQLRFTLSLRRQLQDIIALLD